MNKKEIIKMASAFTGSSGLNIIQEDKAISQPVSGLYGLAILATVL